MGNLYLKIPVETRAKQTKPFCYESQDKIFNCYHMYCSDRISSHLSWPGKTWKHIFSFLPKWTKIFTKNVAKHVQVGGKKHHPVAFVWTRGSFLLCQLHSLETSLPLSGRAVVFGNLWSKKRSWRVSIQKPMLLFIARSSIFYRCSTKDDKRTERLAKILHEFLFVDFWTHKKLLLFLYHYTHKKSILSIWYAILPYIIYFQHPYGCFQK